MKSHRHKRRRGYTLVFFVMLLFGLMAMAALVIDIGFARLAQRQMQTAADSAALEGLRFRDEIPSSLIVSYETELEAACGPVDQNDPTWRDCARLWFAAKRVSDTFDDDLDTTDDDGAFDSGNGQFGAGPLVEFTGGEGDPTLMASQMMSIDPNTPVYKPVMLGGTQSPSGFRVAILRGATDEDADLFSLGPPVPYLFARGSLINRQLIQSGIVVRGVGVAEGRRALSVGVALPSHSLPGSTAFSIRLGKDSANGWIDLADETPATIEIDSAGTVYLATGNLPIGYVNIADGSSQLLSLGQSVLQLRPTPNENAYVSAVVNNAAVVGPSRQVFVTITGDGGVTGNRIIGFGFAELASGSSTNQLTLTKRNSQIAYENASTSATVEIDNSIANDVFAANGELADHSLLAAALVSDP